MSDVVLASVQREDIKPRRRQCHRRGIGARPEEPGSNSVEREPSDLPSRLTELHVVRLGGDVLRNQFRRDLNRRGGKERHQVDRLVVADRSETVNLVTFLSASSIQVSAKLITKNITTQPDRK